MHSEEIDFKQKKIRREKEGNYILIKGSIQLEDITIVNIYTPNARPRKYVKQNLTKLKGEIDSSRVIVGDFRT